jgi:hypothetical protein
MTLNQVATTTYSGVASRTVLFGNPVIPSPITDVGDSSGTEHLCFEVTADTVVMQANSCGNNNSVIYDGPVMKGRDAINPFIWGGGSRPIVQIPGDQTSGETTLLYGYPQIVKPFLVEDQTLGLDASYNDPYVGPWGGSGGGHPSQLFGAEVINPLMAAQNWNVAGPMPALTNFGLTADQPVGTPAAVLPAGAVLTGIEITNNSASAVTGGVDIGTTKTGADVVSAAAVAAGATINITGATLLKTVFSPTSSNPLFVHAHTSWNSANLNVKFYYQ